MPAAATPVDLERTVDRCVKRATEALRGARAVRGYARHATRRELDEVRAVLRTGLLEAADPLNRLELLARIDAERRAVDDQDRRMLEDSRSRVHDAIDRLRQTATSDELITRAPRELRKACGFTRVMVSRAEGTRWVPDTLTVGDGADSDAEEFHRFAHGEVEIPLAHLLRETDMVRRRVPVIVEDALRDPRTSKPLMRVTRSTSYVAAPIVATRRVIGFLHADRLGQDGPVGSEDLECLALFADRFGLLLARSVLAERIERRRSALCSVLDDALEALAYLSSAELQLDTAAAVSATEATHARDGSMPRGEALLTAREREVVQLLATGATNKAIATDLMLSVDTVKSHVSSILRKLGATSRAEAVARFLGTSRDRDHRGP